MAARRAAVLRAHLGAAAPGAAPCAGDDGPMVLSRKEGRVTVVTLNRPKALNAICDQLTREMKAALVAAEGDPGCGCVVVTGAGRAFAAGADIKEMQHKTLAENVLRDFPGSNWNAIADCRIPVVAAVNGLALGGGCEFAMMCDIILASEKAVFGQPEINLGIIPGAGGTQRLTKAVGKSKAMELCLTGGTISAAEARSYNLVSRVVAPDALLPEAMKVAQKIAAQSRPVAMLCKESVATSFETTLKEGVRAERSIFRTTFGLDDRAEGMEAFVAKRKASWRHK